MLGQAKRDDFFPLEINGLDRYKSARVEMPQSETMHVVDIVGCPADSAHVLLEGDLHLEQGLSVEILIVVFFSFEDP